MNEDLVRWLDYLKWKCERYEKGMVIAASLIVAGIAVLTFTLTYIFEDWNYLTVLEIKNLIWAVGVGGGLGFIGMGLIALRKEDLTPDICEELIDEIMHGRIETVDDLKKRLAKLKQKKRSRKKPGD